MNSVISEQIHDEESKFIELKIEIESKYRRLNKIVAIILFLIGLMPLIFLFLDWVIVPNEIELLSNLPPFNFLDKLGLPINGIEYVKYSYNFDLNNFNYRTLGYEHEYDFKLNSPEIAKLNLYMGAFYLFYSFYCLIFAKDKFVGDYITPIFLLVGLIIFSNTPYLETTESKFYTSIKPMQGLGWILSEYYHKIMAFSSILIGFIYFFYKITSYEDKSMKIAAKMREAGMSIFDIYRITGIDLSKK